MTKCNWTKRIVLIGIVAVVATAGIFAGEGREYGASFGYELGKMGDDFHIGLQATTPYLWDFVAFRGSGDWMFHDAADWESYGMARLGVVIGSADLVAGFARFYGGIGATLAFLTDPVSDDDLAWGIYGDFGFEFFTGEESPVSYFIEVGGIGSWVEDLSGEIFLNGLKVTTGFRVYPFKP